jgi:hypothetical protein
MRHEYALIALLEAEDVRSPRVFLHIRADDGEEPQ